MASVTMRIVAQWSEDKRSGSGTFTFADDSSYSGEWIDDKRCAYGICTFVDGSSYI